PLTPQAFQRLFAEHLQRQTLDPGTSRSSTPIPCRPHVLRHSSAAPDGPPALPGRRPLWTLAIMTSTRLSTVDHQTSLSASRRQQGSENEQRHQPPYRRWVWPVRRTRPPCRGPTWTGDDRYRVRRRRVGSFRASPKTCLHTTTYPCCIGRWRCVTRSG